MSVAVGMLSRKREGRVVILSKLQQAMGDSLLPGLVCRVGEGVAVPRPASLVSDADSAVE